VVAFSAENRYVVALAGVWYGLEAMLAHIAGWHLSWRSPIAWALRDLLLPVLWIGGWRGTGRRLARR